MLNEQHPTPRELTEPSLWTTRRVFGVAGGPDEIVLTAEGNLRGELLGALTSWREWPSVAEIRYALESCEAALVEAEAKAHAERDRESAESREASDAAEFYSAGLPRTS